MTDKPWKVVHVQPFQGWEILGEFETEAEAVELKRECLKRAPKEWVMMTRVPSADPQFARLRQNAERVMGSEEWEKIENA